MHAGDGEVVKEKKAAASFDITAIFLLVMQAVVGGTQSFALDCKALCSSMLSGGAYMGQITPLDLRRTTMLDISVNSNRLLSGVLLGNLCHL
ncbi:hypothetical protein D9736_08785 [Escherichia sp. E10V10]|nr:hypothetical protein D9736_08785 [Escherichia sp. E10V10]